MLTLYSGRLLFLDETLTNIIHRFETEYPETRVPQPSQVADEHVADDPSSVPAATLPDEPTLSDPEDLDPEGPPDSPTTISLPRRPSEISLSARNNMSREEGRAHRFGQQLHREVLPPQREDYLHGTTGHEQEAEHLTMLRQKLLAIPGEDIQRRLNEYANPEAAVRSLSRDAEALERLMREDGEGFRRFGECRRLVFGEEGRVLAVPEPGDRKDLSRVEDPKV